jgi:hypothetical protein
MFLLLILTIPFVQMSVPILLSFTKSWVCFQLNFERCFNFGHKPKTRVYNIWFHNWHLCFYLKDIHPYFKRLKKCLYLYSPMCRKVKINVSLTFLTIHFTNEIPMTKKFKELVYGWCLESIILSSLDNSK